MMSLFMAKECFSQRDSLRIAFYNCENYYDSFKDSTIDDADFTPEGARRWSYSRFLAKRNNIFKVFASMSLPNPPEIIGLCEIENRFVLNKLAYDTPLSKFEYAVVHQNSSDRRGIDVGLLYQKDKLHLLDFRYFNPKVVDTSLYTRSILYSVFRWGEFDTLHVFVNHFPSKLGGVRAEKSRLLVAKYLLSKVDSVLHSNKSASVVVIGDFNDVATSDAMQLFSSSLTNLALPLQEQKQGSIKFEGEWELIDQILVSKGLVDADTPVKLLGGMEIYSAPFLFEDDTMYGGKKPRRTFNGYRYNGGFSDHLPVLIKLVRLM